MPLPTTPPFPTFTVWECPHDVWLEVSRYKTWASTSSGEEPPPHVPTTVVEKCAVCHQHRERQTD